MESVAEIRKTRRLPPIRRIAVEDLQSIPRMPPTRTATIYEPCSLSEARLPVYQDGSMSLEPSWALTSAI
jgi:hypothetical protein